MQSLGDSLHLARCALNPPTMQHNRYKIVPTKNPKKVAIIGGGVGGMESALVLKKRGHNPVIFEKSNELGGLFLTASAMTFKENDKALIRWYKDEIKRYNIEVRFNTEVNDLGTLKRSFDEIVVCTGSVLIVLIQGLGLGGQCIDLSLPFLRHLIQLLVGTLIGGDILQDILHIHQCELLG